MSYAGSEEEEVYEVHDDVGDMQMYEALKATCWLGVCGCFGTGMACSKCTDPCCLGTYKCCCCEGYNGTTSFYHPEEGLCMGFSKCCCLVIPCACPPGGTSGDGIPLCALCNCRCGGEEDSSQVSEQKHILNNTFLCFQIIFCGCGVTQCSGPYMKGTNKFCCIHDNFETSECCGDNGCCYFKEKCCCCMQFCVCPPGGGDRDGIPTCAVLGLACCGEAADEEQAPEMEEMMPAGSDEE